MQFGEILKLLREEKGMTQHDVANVLNVGRATIAGYETKGKQPDYDKLDKLAELFNVSSDYLLGRTDIKSPIDEVANALADEPELAEFWNEFKESKDLQQLIKKTKDMSPKEIQLAISIMKAIEEYMDNPE